MIISISGKIGSGKDTVGEIIQKLCITNNGPTFKIKKWAYKVKQVATLLTGIPIEKFEDQEFKESLLGPEWGTIMNNPLNAIPVFEDTKFNHLLSVRELLQKIGTDALRNHLHVNVWVNAMMSEYTEIIDMSPAPHRTSGINMQSLGYPNWIITDTRFPNELKAIKDKGGISIKIVRPHGYTNPHTGEYKEMPLSFHESETALDDATFDYTLLNNGTLVDLIKNVKLILKTENII